MSSLLVYLSPQPSARQLARVSPRQGVGGILLCHSSITQFVSHRHVPEARGMLIVRKLQIVICIISPQAVCLAQLVLPPSAQSLAQQLADFTKGMMSSHLVALEQFRQIMFSRECVYVIVISRARGLYQIYCTGAQGPKARGLRAINLMQTEWP